MTDHVILLSEKSSGSSVFQEEIIKHPQVQTAKWTSHSEAETLYWLKAANILGYPQSSFWNARSPFPPRYCRRSLETILNNNLGYLPQHDNDWEFLVAGWEAMIDKFGPVYFEKSPHHLNQWPALACINRFAKETKKNIKFIGLVRNPLSVVYSTHQRWYSALYERQFMWEQSYRNLLAFQQLCPTDQFLLVRYEDLISSPRNQFERILSFLGLEYVDSIGKSLHTESLSKWEQDMSFSFKIHPTVMQLGHQFGYTRQDMTSLKETGVTMGSTLNYPKMLLYRLRSTVNFYRKHVLK